MKRILSLFLIFSLFVSSIAQAQVAPAVPYSGMTLVKNTGSYLENSWERSGLPKPTPTQLSNTTTAITNGLKTNAGKVIAGAAVIGGAVVGARSAPAIASIIAQGVIYNVIAYVIVDFVITPVWGFIKNPSSISAGAMQWSTVVQFNPTRSAICGDAVTCATANYSAKVNSGACPNSSSTSGTPVYTFSNGIPTGISLPFLLANGASACASMGNASFGNFNGVVNCNAGEFFYPDTGLCGARPTQNANVEKPTVAASPEKMFDKLSDSEKAKPMTDEQIATVADSNHKDAASQPGYNGVPYRQSEPVKKEDVKKFHDEHPEVQRPRVGDMLAPMPNTQSTAATGANANPLVIPNTVSPLNPTVSPSTPTLSSPTTPGGTTVNIDLGPNPNLQEPALETPPMIDVLKPLTDLIQPFKNVNFAGLTGQCPTFGFNIWNRPFVIDFHCSLIDSQMGNMRSLSILGGTLASVFILLAA